MNALPQSSRWPVTVDQNRYAGVTGFGASCKIRHARCCRASIRSPSSSSRNTFNGNDPTVSEISRTAE
jgi:hypothetical protein